MFQYDIYSLGFTSDIVKHYMYTPILFFNKNINFYYLIVDAQKKIKASK